MGLGRIIGALLAVGLMLTGCTPTGQSGVLTRLPGPAVTPLPRFTPSPIPQEVPPPTHSLRDLTGVHIVVDAGHGGKDPGASSKFTSLPEKTITLSIANALTKELKARGANITLTRSGDTYPTLDERAHLAEKSKTDLFVSIHADSAGRASASGTGLFVAPNASSHSESVARRLQSAFKQAGIKCRGIQRGRSLRVLVAHSRPAILIETGFLSNRGDALNLAKASYRQRLAKVIADGLSAHFQTR